MFESGFIIIIFFSLYKLTKFGLTTIKNNIKIKFNRFEKSKIKIIELFTFGRITIRSIIHVFLSYLIHDFYFCPNFSHSDQIYFGKRMKFMTYSAQKHANLNTLEFCLKFD